MEQWFADVCNSAGTPIWMTGSGDFWVSGRNPDFKVHDRKLVIEVTDGYATHQHRRTVENYALPTIDHYERHGYACLVVMLLCRRNAWQSQAMINHLTSAVNDFIATESSAVWLCEGSIGSFVTSVIGPSSISKQAQAPTSPQTA